MNSETKKAELLTESLFAFSSLYGRRLDSLVIQRYVEIVVSELTEQQLNKAIEGVWRTCKRFPLPADFLELGKAVKSWREEGLSEWVLICNALPTQPENLSQRGKYALQTLGGAYSLGQVSLKERGYLKADFLRAYEIYQPGMELIEPKTQGADAKELRQQQDELERQKGDESWKRGFEQCRNVLAAIAKRKKRVSPNLDLDLNEPTGAADPTERPNYSEAELEAIIAQAKSRYDDAKQESDRKQQEKARSMNTGFTKAGQMLGNFSLEDEDEF